VANLPEFETALFRRSHGNPVTVEVLRGKEKLSFTVPVIEESQNELDDLADLVNPDKSLVRGLGILGVEIAGPVSELVSDLRISTGVIVAARAAEVNVETGLKTGDVIHAVNGASIETLEELRAAVDRLKPGAAVALQIERDGVLMYLAFETE
jgi:S1-C subfamily serine protease